MEISKLEQLQAKLEAQEDILKLVSEWRRTMDLEVIRIIKRKEHLIKKIKAEIEEEKKCVKKNTA